MLEMVESMPQQLLTTDDLFHYRIVNIEVQDSD